jgi:hypothetical protein
MDDMNEMVIEYKTAVLVAAGWRPVVIRAEAQRTSPRMAVVTRVRAIDDKAPTGYTSRTGAKRQTFDAAGIARREVGARKRLSCCEVVA